MTTDYIQQLINYVPWFVILGMIIGVAKYGSKYATEKMKFKKKEESQVTKPKGIVQTLIDGIEQAPQAKQILDAEIQNLMSKGATEEQLKSLKSKKQFVDLLANQYVQMIGPGVIDFAKTNLKGIVKI